MLEIILKHCTVNCTPTAHCLAPALAGLTSLHEESSCCAGSRSSGCTVAGYEAIPLGPGGVESCVCVTVLEDSWASPLSHHLLAKAAIPSLLVHFLFQVLPIVCVVVSIAGTVVSPAGSCSASIVLLQFAHNNCRTHTYQRKYVRQWY